MKIGKIHIILLITFLFIAPFNSSLASVIFLALYITALPAISESLAEYVYGIRMVFPRFEERGGQGAYIYLKHEYGKYRVGTALKIRGVKHNIHDLDAYGWIGRASSFIDNCIKDYDVDYKFIYVKERGNFRYLIDIAVDGDDLNTVRYRLFDMLSAAKSNLDAVGLEYEIASKEDLILPLKFEEARTRWWVPISLMLVTAYLLWRFRFDLFGMLTVAAVPILLLISIVMRGGGKRYRLLNEMVVVKEDKVAYRDISVEELYGNARYVHNSLSKSIYDYVIVIKLSRIPTGEVEDMRGKFYSKSRWGEAMGRYEMLDEARKYGGLTDRNERGESLYRCDMAVYVNSQAAARQAQAVLEKLGLKATNPLVKGRHIKIY